MDAAQNSSPEISEAELMRKMEDEHLRLKRQAQMIQTDRMQRVMGVHPLFRRQEMLLHTLKKEYINLVKDLKIARSGAHKKKDRKMKIELKDALILKSMSTVDCEEGMSLIEELDGLIRRNYKDNLQLKKMANTTKGQLDQRRIQSEHQLSSTENKLENAMLRFNSVQYENKKIRAEIEHMLKDRLLFNQSWDKMLGALKKGKKFLADLFESSTLAYDQREEWCRKLQSLQEKGKMDQNLQIQEMRDLQKALDHEMKVYYFLAKKGVMRINLRQEEREIEDSRLEEERLQKVLEEHKKILAEIFEYSNKTKEKDIIEEFERVEQENFSVYSLLTEYCAENIVLDKDLRHIRTNLDDYRDWNEAMESKRQVKLQKLRDELEKKQSNTEQLKLKLENQNQCIKTYMDGIYDIFNLGSYCIKEKYSLPIMIKHKYSKHRQSIQAMPQGNPHLIQPDKKIDDRKKWAYERTLNCSLEPFQNLLGDKEPSTNLLNMTKFLITEKIKENLELIYYNERMIQKKKDKSVGSRLKKYLITPELPRFWNPVSVNLYVSADPCPSCIEARFLSRLSETPEVPFNKEMTVAALTDLISDPAHERCDRIHPLSECRLPVSRAIFARRYL